MGQYWVQFNRPGISFFPLDWVTEHYQVQIILPDARWVKTSDILDGESVMNTTGTQGLLNVDNLTHNQCPR